MKKPPANRRRGVFGSIFYSEIERWTNDLALDLSRRQTAIPYGFTLKVVFALLYKKQSLWYATYLGGGCRNGEGLLQSYEDK